MVTESRFSSESSLQKKDGKQSSGIYSTAFNLANLILGVGALAMPQAFSQSGIISGLILLGLMCICGHYTSILVVKCANKVGVDSYESLTEKILGSPGYLFFCTLCVFTNVGAAMCYIMFIKQCTQLSNDNLILLCSVVILPLCFVKDWESLSILSKIKTFVYGMIVLFVVVRASVDPYTQSTIAKPLYRFVDSRQTWFSMNILESIGTFAFAVIYHDCLFCVKSTMRNQSIDAWDKASKFTLLIVFAISALLGVGGFVNFRVRDGRTFPDNVFTADEHDRLFQIDYWFNTARYVLVGLLLVTVPLCVHCARDYIESMIAKLTTHSTAGENVDQHAMKKEIEGGASHTNNVEVKVKAADSVGLEELNEEKAEEYSSPICLVRVIKKFEMTALEYIISIGLFAMVMALSIYFEERAGIKGVIDAVGDYALASIAFIFPPIIYLCTFYKEYSMGTVVTVLFILIWGLFIWFRQTTKMCGLVDWEFESKWN